MNPAIETKFATYPAAAQRLLGTVRRLIFSIAKEEGLGEVEETLKWGEASYLVKGGTTIRIDWKPKDPGCIKVYFHCQTKLVDTFKQVYQNEFEYEGNRAIIVPLDAKVDKRALGHCLQMALKYHSLKHQPLLGA